MDLKLNLMTCSETAVTTELHHSLDLKLYGHLISTFTAARTWNQSIGWRAHQWVIGSWQINARCSSYCDHMTAYFGQGCFIMSNTPLYCSRLKSVFNGKTNSLNTSFITKIYITSLPGSYSTTSCIGFPVTYSTHTLLRC